MRRFLFIALALACGLATAQVYKWTDPSGKVHYGDSPPAETKTEQLRIQIPSYDGPVKVQDWSGVIRRKYVSSIPDRPKHVTMYSTAWCVHCKNARNYFASQGISFTEVDVEKSEEGRKEFQSFTGSGVPLIVVGSKTMRGFSASAFESMRKAAARS